MFNLDQAISEWQRQMTAGGVSTPEVLTELESHLRDDVEHQIQTGISEPQAFAMAVQRLGQASLLKAEFNKESGIPDPRLKLIIFAGTWLLLSVVFGYGMITHDMSGLERFSGFGALAVAALGGFVCRHAAQWVRAAERIRTAIGVAGVILGAVWLTCFILYLLPLFEFTPNQLVVALLWALVPIFATWAFQIGLEETKAQEPGARLA